MTERCTRPIQLRITPSEYKEICDHASRLGFTSIKAYVMKCIEHYRNYKPTHTDPQRAFKSGEHKEDIHES